MHYPNKVVELLCCGVFLFFLTNAWPLAQASSNPPSPILQITRAPLAIPIKDQGMTFRIGDRLKFIQANEKFYIALAKKPHEETEVLVAIEKKTRKGKGSAWITHEKELVIAQPTRSKKGLFYFNEEKRIPIVSVDQEAYKIRVKKFGKQFDLAVPKKTKHIDIHWPPKEPSTDTQQATYSKPVDREPPPPANNATEPVTPTESVVPQPSTSNAPSIVAQTNQTTTHELAVDQITSQSETNQVELLAKKLSFTTALKFIEPAKQFFKTSSGLVIPIILLLFLFVLLIVLRVRSTGKETKKPEQPTKTQSSSEDEPTEDEIDDQSTEQQDLSPDMAGSLKGFSPTELVQFLNSAEDSGLLVIEQKKGEEIARFFVEDGNFCFATCGDKAGDEAILEFLTMSEGSFSFTKNKTIEQNPNVKQNTMSLLLNFHRICDEENTTQV